MQCLLSDLISSLRISFDSSGYDDKRHLGARPLIGKLEVWRIIEPDLNSYQIHMTQGGNTS